MNLKNEALKNKLIRIDGRGYKAYKEIKGNYEFSDFILSIDHVQGDPFAVPSKIRILLPLAQSEYPAFLYHSKIREIAFRDFIAREFHRAISNVKRKNQGNGNSGLIEIDSGRQEVLERNSVVLKNGNLEVRFWIGLPARGRTILGKEAQDIFFQHVPLLVNKSLFYKNIDSSAIQTHVETVEDTEALRTQLKKKGLVGFIGNGASLPRATGIDDRPLKNAVEFKSPSSLEITLDAPHNKKTKGMGIPEGVTLIVGGGFHGKSTVLKALERGVYNHIPGDGRELAVSLYHSVKIKAEEGRRVEKVNISSFINHLPFGRNTIHFCTENSSGSTSQAANIIEGLEMGAEALLIDEDTSATNFMIRDERMQKLVVSGKEPITPLVDRIHQLKEEQGISTIIVMGGSGDYFDVADTVIMMDEYLPVEVTQKAKRIVKEFINGRQIEAEGTFDISSRKPDKGSFNPSKGKRDVKIQARGTKNIEFGREMIDISQLDQLIDPSQARAIGLAIQYYASRTIGSSGTFREGLEMVIKELENKGLDLLSPHPMITGNMAMPRIFELAGAINRMRCLKC